MKLLVLTLVTLFACKGTEAKKHGPPLTPATADRLKSIAPECEIRSTKSERGTRELRLCKGRQSMMTIHLDEHRNLIEIEIGVWAPMFAEAEQLIRLAISPGLVSEAGLAALKERLAGTKSNPIVVDGVRIDAFYTQKPNENPRYTAVLSW